MESQPENRLALAQAIGPTAVIGGIGNVRGAMLGGYLIGAVEVMTNTLHGQGIARPSPHIVIDGHAPDGTPEAIYVAGAAGFTLAVQWHPEWDAGSNPDSAAFFQLLGRAMRGES